MRHSHFTLTAREERLLRMSPAGQETPKPESQEAPKDEPKAPKDNKDAAGQGAKRLEGAKGDAAKVGQKAGDQPNPEATEKAEDVKRKAEDAKNGAKEEGGDKKDKGKAEAGQDEKDASKEKKETPNEKFDRVKDEQIVRREQQKYADAPKDKWATIPSGIIDNQGNPFLYKESSMKVDGQDKQVLLAFSPTTGPQVMDLKTGKWEMIDSMSADQKAQIKGIDDIAKTHEEIRKAEEKEDPKGTKEKGARNGDNRKMEDGLKSPGANPDWFKENKGADYWKDGSGNQDIRKALEGALGEEGGDKGKDGTGDKADKKPDDKGDKKTPDVKDESKGVDAKKTENVKEGEPKTNAEKLDKQLGDAMKKLENAKNPTDALKAILEVIAVAIEYIQKALNGTLKDDVSKTDSKGKEIKGDKSKEKSAENTPREKLLDEMKNGPHAKLSMPEQIAKTKEDKNTKIAENEQSIDTTNKDIEAVKTDNTKLQTEENDIKTKLNELEGKDDATSKDLKESLNGQLKVVTGKKEVNANRMRELTDKRDAKTKENENLKKDQAELNKMGKDVSDAVSHVESTLKTAMEIFKTFGQGKEAPFKGFKIESSGTERIITLEGVSPKLMEVLKPLSKSNDDKKGTATIDLDNKDFKEFLMSDGLMRIDTKPTEKAADAKPANETKSAPAAKNVASEDPEAGMHYGEGGMW